MIARSRRIPATIGVAMDTLLSPRRRTVLQALGAAALVAGCGDRPAPRRAAVEFGGPTMGSTYTVKIAGPRARRGDRGRRARRRRRRARRGRRRRMSDVPAGLGAVALQPAPRRRAVRAVRRHARRVRAGAAGERRHRRRVRHHRRAGRRRMGLRPGQRAARRRRRRGRGARGARRLADARRSTRAARHGGQGAARTCAPTCRASPRATPSTGPRARSTRSASPTTWSRPAARSARAGAMPRAGRGRSRSSAPTPMPQRAASHRAAVRPVDGDLRRLPDLLRAATAGATRHEIDPATGQPIRHGLASVSVVAPRVRLCRRDGHRADRAGARQGLRAGGGARRRRPLHRARARTARLRDRQTPAFAALGGTPSPALGRDGPR